MFSELVWRHEVMRMERAQQLEYCDADLAYLDCVAGAAELAFLSGGRVTAETLKPEVGKMLVHYPRSADWGATTLGGLDVHVDLEARVDGEAGGAARETLRVFRPRGAEFPLLEAAVLEGSRGRGVSCTFVTGARRPTRVFAVDVDRRAEVTVRWVADLELNDEESGEWEDVVDPEDFRVRAGEFDETVAPEAGLAMSVVDGAEPEDSDHDDILTSRKWEGEPGVLQPLGGGALVRGLAVVVVNNEEYSPGSWARAGVDEREEVLADYSFVGLCFDSAHAAAQRALLEAHQERMVAVCMGRHKRVGAGSVLGWLNGDVLRALGAQVLLGADGVDAALMWRYWVGE